MNRIDGSPRAVAFSTGTLQELNGQRRFPLARWDPSHHFRFITNNHQIKTIEWNPPEEDVNGVFHWPFQSNSPPLPPQTSIHKSQISLNVPWKCQTNVKRTQIGEWPGSIVSELFKPRGKWCSTRNGRDICVVAGHLTTRRANWNNRLKKEQKDATNSSIHHQSTSRITKKKLHPTNQYINQTEYESFNDHSVDDLLHS